jgi:hypothetical protein
MVHDGQGAFCFSSSDIRAILINGLHMSATFFNLNLITLRLLFKLLYDHAGRVFLYFLNSNEKVGQNMTKPCIFSG